MEEQVAYSQHQFDRSQNKCMLSTTLGFPGDMSHAHCVKSLQIQSFFWSVFSRIRTEYGEIRSISPYSVLMRENTVQKKLHIWTFFTQWLHETCSILTLKVLGFSQGSLPS